MMGKKKVKTYLFYNDKAVPQIETFDYITDFHCDNCLQWYLVMANEYFRTPFLVVMYVGNKLYGFASYKEREKEKRSAVAVK